MELNDEKYDDIDHDHDNDDEEKDDDDNNDKNENDAFVSLKGEPSYTSTES